MTNTPNEKVRQLQRKLWVCAKSSKTRRFNALYDRISPELMERTRVLRRRGFYSGISTNSRRPRCMI
jgi:hypothetical protein